MRVGLRVADCEAVRAPLAVPDVLRVAVELPLCEIVELCVPDIDGVPVTLGVELVVGDWLRVGVGVGVPVSVGDGLHAVFCTVSESAGHASVSAHVRPSSELAHAPSAKAP